MASRATKGGGTKPRCSKQVYSSGGSFKGYPCGLPPIVEVDGRWFCRVHSPDAVAKRRDALSAKWQAEQERIDRTTRIAPLERAVIEQARLWAGLTRHVYEDGPLIDAVRALEGGAPDVPGVAIRWQRTRVAIAELTAINNRIAAERDRYLAALMDVEIHCPCGARPESLNTHPHVGGCPVGKALHDKPAADRKEGA